MSLSLRNFHPIKSLMHRLHPDDADAFFKEFDVAPASGYFNIAPRIKLDVSESDEAYTVRAEIPGVEKEDIDVSIDGNRVTIAVESSKEKERKEAGEVICRERYFGQQYRSFTLAGQVDKDKASATYRHGVLKLALPKLADKAGGGRLAIG
ncbi:MAG TPA: Hsp20/alpha crystallin family protein [Burkholderiaceae bacterium]